jgi:hypothetical protein
VKGYYGLFDCRLLSRSNREASENTHISPAAQLLLLVVNVLLLVLKYTTVRLLDNKGTSGRLWGLYKVNRPSESVTNANAAKIARKLEGWMSMKHGIDRKVETDLT